MRKDQSVLNNKLGDKLKDFDILNLYETLAKWFLRKIRFLVLEGFVIVVLPSITFDKE